MKTTRIQVKPSKEDVFFVDKVLANSGLKKTEENVGIGGKHEEKDTKKDEDTDLMELWRLFRDDTSMHGLKHSTLNGGYKLRWIIWIIAIVIMVSFLVYTLWTQLRDYAGNPTLTNIAVHHKEELPFPAVTICNLSPYKKSNMDLDPQLSYYYLATSRLQQFMPTPNMSHGRFHAPGNNSFLSGASFDWSDIISFCVFQNAMEDCSKVISTRVTETGICFTFNNHDSPSGLRTTSFTGSKLSLTLYMRIDQNEYIYNDFMAAGVKFLLHDPYEEPDMVNLGYLAPPGFTVNAAIKMTKYKYLPTPYMAFGDSLCLDTKSSTFKNHLQYFPYYSVSACVRECKRNKIVSICGCRKHTDPGNETICSLHDMYFCYSPESKTFDTDIASLRSCNCPKPCEFTQYTAMASSAVFPATVYDVPLTQMGFTNLRKDHIELNIFYESLTYQYIEQIPQFTPESIIGILGGQMGIFLGASILTLSELLEFVILSMYVITRRMWNKMKARRSP